MLFTIDSTAAAQPVQLGLFSPSIIRAEQAVQNAFPRLTPGIEYPFCTGADWSTHDLIEHLLTLIGPCQLTATTWSVSEAACSKMIAMLNDGRLTAIRFLVDWRVKVRTPGFMAIAKQHFADIRVGNCHAKVFVLKNERWAISVVGSSNFTNNPRVEAGHLSTSPQVADFHQQWIMAEINNAAPFGEDMNKRSKKSAW